MRPTEEGVSRQSLGLLLLLLLLLSAADREAAAQKDPERKVLYRLEYIDIDKVLENNRMLTAFIRCFMRQGPCTPEARDFRKLLPKLAVSMCSDCTPRQRFIIKQVFGHLMEHRPKEWEQLLDRFDPQRKYAERLHTFMADYPPATTSEAPPESASSLGPDLFGGKTEMPAAAAKTEPPAPSKSKSLKKAESRSKYDSLKASEPSAESPSKQAGR